MRWEQDCEPLVLFSIKVLQLNRRTFDLNITKPQTKNVQGRKQLNVAGHIANSMVHSTFDIALLLSLCIC